MANPINLGTIVDQSTGISTAWGQGVNDWTYGWYGVLGSTYTSAGLRTALGVSNKAGTTTYDLSTATGTQVITGVGFQPTRVHILVAVAGTSLQTTGFSDGTNNYCVANTYSSAVDGIQTDNCSIMRTGLNDYQKANIVTFGADGFTINWVKTGVPTGIATIAYIAER